MPSAEWAALYGRKTYSPAWFGADAWLSMKFIVSTCPIHSACTIQVVFGADADERIPYPDPDLKEIAERDFPDLVPVRVQHHPAHVVWAGSG